MTRTLGIDIGLSVIAMLILAVLTVAVVGGALNGLALLLVLAAALPFTDAVRWLRGRGDIFDPGVLLGVFAPVYLVVGPLTQIGREYWLGVVRPGDDSFLTLWALLYLVGFTLYRIVVDWPAKRMPQRQVSSWRPGSRFWLAAAIVLILGVTVQAWLYARYGGISGWVSLYTMRQQMNYRNFGGFDGIGVEVMFGEAVKIIAPIVVILLCERRRWSRSSWALLGLILFTLVTALVFGGLRGSRGAVVSAVLFAVILYHFRVRRISKGEALALAGAGATFVIGYMFYKFGGLDGLLYLLGAADRSPLASRFEVPMEYVLTRDLSRMDIQALVLERQLADGYPLYWGRSFVFAPTVLIPDALGLQFPPHFIYEKSEYLLGPGLFTEAGSRQVTTLFGSFAEFLIAFGIPGALGFFVLLGLCIRLTRRFRPPDRSMLILFWPLLSQIGVQLLLKDSASLALIYFKWIFPIALVLVIYALLPGRRQRVRQMAVNHG